MKAKKFLMTLFVIASLMVPFSFISFSYGNPHPSAEDIEWGVKEGKKYTWVVKVSNESLGFPPVGAKFEIKITSIRSMLSGDATELNATITRYTSAGEVAEVRLNNERFIYFEHIQKKNFSFYAPFYDHCFFAPKNYATNFADGIRYYFDHTYNFGSMGSMVYYGKLTSVHGEDPSSDLLYMWEFSNYIGHKLIVSYSGEYSDGIYQYVLELQGSGGVPAISYGNFFLIFTGLAILSLIYIHKKRVK